MSRHKSTLGLVAFFTFVVFCIGCFPENSLKWSEDGSVGLLHGGGGLYLVDGKTGALTEIESQVDLLPDISKDGKLVVYSEQVSCDNLSEGLKLLPPGQMRMIEHCAQQMKKNILAAGKLPNDQFGFPEEGLLIPNDYRNWAIRYLLENADSELLKIIGDEGIQKAKERSISYFQIVVVQADNPAQRRMLTANIFRTVAARLSPDGRFVAYLMHTQEGEVSNAFEEFGLYVASIEGDVKAVYIDSRVAFSYDWRKDGKALAYLSADSKNLLHDDFILGTLNEKMVVDTDGNLLAEWEGIPENGSAGTHRCTGQKIELAGTAFYFWFKVEYGLDNRVFFSSLSMPLPMSKRDEPKCSLFCYDPVTGMVTDVLPLNVSDYVNKQVFSMSLFSLSPDGKHVLLPIKNNRFIAYTLGTGSMEIPIPEEEGFGEEEIPELAPSWKGNREVSFLVSGKSKYLPESEDDQAQADRREIIVLGPEEKSWVLSESWPDELKVEPQENK
jgi:hypothetical protein